MKSYRLFFYVSIILSTFFLISCDDEPLDVGFEIDGPNEGATGTITAKIAEVDATFVGNAGYIPLEEEEGEEYPSRLHWNIMGTAEDGATVSMFLFNADIQPNQFTLGDETTFHHITYMPSFEEMMDNPKMYSSISGMVKITEIDLEEKTISGTFNAVLEFDDLEGERETIEITNGKIIEVDFIRGEG